MLTLLRNLRWGVVNGLWLGLVFLLLVHPIVLVGLVVGLVTSPDGRIFSDSSLTVAAYLRSVLLLLLCATVLGAFVGLARPLYTRWEGAALTGSVVVLILFFLLATAGTAESVLTVAQRMHFFLIPIGLIGAGAGVFLRHEAKRGEGVTIPSYLLDLGGLRNKGTLNKGPWNDTDTSA